MISPGIITKISANSFENTYAKLKSIVEENPNLTVLLELDHSANAANAVGEDLSLNPTKLIVFGNPVLGTPLMKNAQTAGLDLPQKILVHEDESAIVRVSYNDPMYLKDRHNILNNDDVLLKIANALNKIVTAITH